MSRLIVKNLPDNVKESRLRELFTSKGGELTDLKLCYTKNGIFRKFAYVGYRLNEHAQKALKYFDKTFIDTSKIHVELCKNVGDKSMARPWSKYSKESSAYQRKIKEKEERKKRIAKLQGNVINEDTEAKVKKKSNKHLEELEEISKDPEFQEFLSVHSNKSKKEVWTNENVKNDLVKTESKKNKSSTKECLFEESEHSSSDSESESSDPAEVTNTNEDVVQNEQEEEDEEDSDKETGDKGKKKSDMDWLRSKVSKTMGEPTPVLTVTEESDEKARDHNASSEEETDEKRKKKKKKEQKEISITSTTLKLRGVPFKCKEEDIIEFFKPIFIEDIRFTKNEKNKRTGYVYVDFQNIDDVKKALKKDKKKIKKRFIELFPVQEKETKEEDKSKKWLQSNNDEEEEDLSDTGRIFVRNLSYTCTERDLETLFSKYGDVVEINLPIDKNSNKTTGYAFVTFMIPEHAIKAFGELDGTVFQGRILYLVPGKSKKTKEDKGHDGGTSAYKRKKDAEQKSLSSSSHNWNALFLGQNAIADIMAERLNKSKKDILDSDNSKSSAAVRMALGETELVSETRQFLESQGVKLDVFGQATSARSKNIILVKNLPIGTHVSEIKEIFCPFGDLGRVLMPPFGITAIVEFINNSNAKNAFTNLAYSKFKHTPLYLEWAPGDTLSGEVTVKNEEVEEDVGSELETDGEEETSGCTLFVKNLSFDTSEEKLKKWFSSCGKISSATIAKKKDPKKPGHFLSMGYGFIEYKKAKSVDKALKSLQNSSLDGHNLELKKSHRETIAPKASRKRTKEKEQSSSKIVVRNIPFEANEKEIRELFSTFGHIKSLRLPKKLTGTGKHRGFAFVDFTTKQEAKKAFKALCQSTHLYGRRLVLEWAEDDDSVDALRLKTAEHFHEEPQSKKKKSDLINSIDNIAVKM